MKFQLRDHGWAIGAGFYVPAGTIIDSESTFPSPDDPAFSTHLETYRWSQLVFKPQPSAQCSAPRSSDVRRHESDLSTIGISDHDRSGSGRDRSVKGARER